MHTRTAQRRWQGFTLLEMLAVTAIVGILAALLLPALQKAHVRARQTWCASNVRQIGIAFSSFAHEHNGLYPQQVSVAAGGAYEFDGMAPILPGDLLLSPAVFRVMSNELGSVKIVACPATEQRPTNFATLKTGETSYFSGLHAVAGESGSILSGDNNVARFARTNRFDTSPAVFGWTHPRHDSRGNLLFGDGHVEQLKSFTFEGFVPKKRSTPITAPK
jgi:prepilin-type N-terminal cleavage/methylation domain-containing protein/prepilin-type processing-associated H-X9-DG protein